MERRRGGLILARDAAVPEEVVKEWMDGGWT